MNNFRFVLATVREVENIYSNYIKDGKHDTDQPFDGLRIRAEIVGKDYPKANDPKYLPWAFPLLPKTFQSIPKEGETVLLLCNDDTESQRYYIGPIISQPQFNGFCTPENASTLLNDKAVGKKNSKDMKKLRPLERISNNGDTKGAFPKSSDVAVIGRGAEDMIMRYNNTTKESEIQLRAGIRQEPINDPNPNMIGNIIFNGVDPAYIQMKYKSGLAKGENQTANSIINMVANRINLISNKDDNVSDNLKDNNSLIANNKMDDVMSKLHQVPMGDKLVYLLELIKGAIMHHVHPWAGMEQCGDWSGYIKELEKFDINSILSQYVRIS